MNATQTLTFPSLDPGPQNQSQLNPELQEESQARIDFLADAWQGSAECKAVSEWQEEIPYPDLLEVHRTFKMRHFQATSWTQFVFTFKRNLQAIYRCVRVCVCVRAWHD